LYGLAQNGEFAKRWLSDPLTPNEVPALANRLEQEGARNYAQNEANRLTEAALTALEQAQPQGEAGQALTELAHILLQREI
jgi:geranylgeranyl pyrophosphate synthase